MFFSPRLSGLVAARPGPAACPSAPDFCADAAHRGNRGDWPLAADRRGPLKAERGRSASFDITRAQWPAVGHAHAVSLDASRSGGSRRTDSFVAPESAGADDQRRARGARRLEDGGFSFVGNYAYVRSRETAEESRVDVPLTPRHSVGLDAVWEWEGDRTARHRVVLHRHTAAGREPVSDREPAVQRLRRSRHASVRPRAAVHQRREPDRCPADRWDPFVRPARGVDGRWTVDAWAPLDGRNINGGVRISF